MKSKERLQYGDSICHSTCLKKDSPRTRLVKKEQEQLLKRLAKSTADLSSTDGKKVLPKSREKDGKGQKIPSSGTVVKSSTTLYSPALTNGKVKSAYDKSLKVVVAISSKGQDTSRKSAESPVTSKAASLKSSSTTSSPSFTCKTVLAEIKKPGAIIKQPERVVSSIRSLTSSSEAMSDTSKRKRVREKPQTIVKSVVQKPVTIKVNPDTGKKKVEVKRKLRKEKNGGVTGTKRFTNGRKTEDENLQKDNIENEEPNIKHKFSKTDEHSSTLAINEIKKYHEATRSDTFFQNLFLRSIPSIAINETVPPRKSIVCERARIYQENLREGCRSEPSLKSLSIYLAHKRPVSNSKFKNWEHESLSSRSSSPYGVSWPGRSVLQKVSKFDSLLGINDFGSSMTLCDASPDSARERIQKRSSSEPPLKTLSECTDSRYSSSRTSSPSPVRSPACRRIRTLKQDKLDSQSTASIRKVRARSAGEAEELQRARAKFGSNLSLARSTASFCTSPIDREEYHQYVLELLHDKRKSERYRELHNFYSSLERLGQLERTFSSSDLRPRMKSEEIIDYDQWKSVRSQEKAEIELNALYEKLKTVQKNKDFLFTTRDVSKFKWRGDCGLRCKERSVENIIQHFKKIQSEGSELESTKRKDISSRKDTYKPLWRGTSVINVANTMQRKAEGDRTIEKSLDYLDQPALQRSLGGSKKFWSSLSIEQVTTLKKQLNEIYGSDNFQKSVPSVTKANPEVLERKREATDAIIEKRDSLSKYEIVVPPQVDSVDSPRDDGRGLHVRCHSMITAEVSPNDQKSPNRPESALKRSDSISRGKIEKSEAKKAVMIDPVDE